MRLGHSDCKDNITPANAELHEVDLFPCTLSPVWLVGLLWVKATAGCKGKIPSHTEQRTNAHTHTHTVPPKESRPPEVRNTGCRWGCSNTMFGRGYSTLKGYHTITITVCVGAWGEWGLWQTHSRQRDTGQADQGCCSSKPPSTQLVTSL